MTTSTVMKKLSIATAGAAIIALGTAIKADAAGFAGAYDPSNWTLTNSNANGSVNTTNAPLSITVTGSNNNGNGGFGQTAYKTTASSGGLVSFDWNYTTLDWSAVYDPFGFLLNGVYINVTNANLGAQSGNFSTSVAAGDIFGFAVDTVDNGFGAATVTISNFKAPQAVPEPASVLGLLAFGALGAVSLKRKQQQKATVKA